MRLPRSFGVKVILALAFSFMALAWLPAGNGRVLRASQQRRPGPVSTSRSSSSAASSGLIPAPLRTLATSADRKQGRSALARYAGAATSREAKGLAYFTLGYREFQAHSPAAISDLAQAASTGFSLVDYAEYYRAAAKAEFQPAES